MNELVEIVKKIGKYELGLSELREIKDAWANRRGIADLIKNAAGSSLDIAARYALLAGQVAVLSGAYFGNVNPSEAIAWSTVAEMSKLLVHTPMAMGSVFREYPMRPINDPITYYG